LKEINKCGNEEFKISTKEDLVKLLNSMQINREDVSVISASNNSEILSEIAKLIDTYI